MMSTVTMDTARLHRIPVHCRIRFGERGGHESVPLLQDSFKCLEYRLVTFLTPCSTFHGASAPPTRRCGRRGVIQVLGGGNLIILRLKHELRLGCTCRVCQALNPSGISPTVKQLVVALKGVHLVRSTSRSRLLLFWDGDGDARPPRWLFNSERLWSPYRTCSIARSVELWPPTLIVGPEIICTLLCLHLCPYVSITIPH